MLNKFINCYNNYITSKREYFHRQGIYNEGYDLIVEKKQFEKNDFKLIDLVQKYAFESSAQIPEFFVLDDCLRNSINPNWIAFAEYLGRNWFYTFDTENNNVFLVNQENNKKVFECAINDDFFLQSMCIILNIESIRFRKNLEIIQDGYLREKFAECVTISGNSLSEDFFKFIIGL
ncbi:hypothetical protein [Nonlabens ulvanivorans]|uniref:Uncharacterized protein n=1 Tax=Nonlabens ulvanivorans TaxID=906888 RepID=A0A084JSN4_NONUL|nr:hypothetical protein [Nonlabens ulvanivorans]KEZ91968.1 hypothetical protein IL45_14820 [Nonlabens ulvanivorans]PRX10587.1 hypothetical protein LY02_02889 [Nonlabens ulvanivorans]